MILLPSKYDNLNLERQEKIFINKLKNKISDENIMLLNIKTMMEVQSNNIIIFKEGVTFIENIALDNLELIEQLFDSIYINLHNKKVEKIKAKLLNNRYFYNNKIFTECVSYKYFFKKYSIFEDDLYNNFIDENSIKNILLGDINKFDIEKECIDSFISIFAPEYTVPIYKEPLETNNKKHENLENNKIEKTDLMVEVFRLDDEQINIINDIDCGNKLMLACAGSGKSVLLISKCFKIASLYEEKRFLLTCYNKNLNEMYNWRIGLGGFRERNVDCFTFHKLCRVLLDEANVEYNFVGDDDSDFENIFNLARQKLDDGTITRKYCGIFIDEVQVFNPEWYKFCYDLLEDKNEKNHFFVICGDKSQDVANNIEKGKTVWQSDKSLPSFDEDMIRLEKNYRNTNEINQYVDELTEKAKNYARKYKFEFLKDKDYILRGNAIKHGNKPKIIKSDRGKESEDVIKEIKRLNDNGIELHDIAVLFVQKKYEPSNYYIYSWVKKKLDENYIDYSELSPDKGDNRISYGYRQGVTLCTVNSALGLDFKAVILCGIYPLGLYNKSDKERDLKNANSETIKDYIKNINMLYTGCTRARDELSIILTKSNNSVYEKILNIENVGM